MTIPLIVEKIREYKDRNWEYWLARLSDRTGLGHIAIENVFRQRKEKYKISTLDSLYDYFKLEKDEWYRANLKKWHEQHDSILGNIFREKRISMSYTISRVAREIRVDEKTIKNIETGSTLPHFNQYTFKKLLNLYDFSDEERTTIAWWITITHDLMMVYKKTIDTNYLGKNIEELTMEP